MNFARFQDWRATLLLEHPTLLDAGETNLYRALSWLQVPPSDDTPAHIHRCHLAQAWLAHVGLSESLAAQALVSSGVRDSLATLFTHYKKRGLCARLAGDNYPVYQSLAEKSGLSHLSFPTMPRVVWPADGDVLLVTNPLKPRGSFLDAGDVDALLAWLSGDSERRLLIDAAYDQESPFHISTLRLLETGQAILLHSLTKGWLQPKLFGIALVPAQDLEQLAEEFRARSPSMAQLRHADHLLRNHAELPNKVADSLMLARESLWQRLPLALRPKSAHKSSYLFPLSINHEELLSRHRILGIPASVFGSADTTLTIVSSLNAIKKC